MKFISLLFTLTVCATISPAALIPVLKSTAPGSTPGTTTYSYTVSLAADERIDTINPARVSIFNFAGYVAGSLSVGTGAGSWTGTAVPVGSLYNLVFDYSGPAVNGAVNPIFDFVADSTYNLQTLSTFLATDSKNSPNPLEDGTPATNGGAVAVPLASLTEIPEPATMSLMGGALLGLLALRNRVGSTLK